MKRAIPEEMYAALEGEVLESPNWEEGIPDEVTAVLDKLYEVLDEEQVQRYIWQHVVFYVDGEVGGQ